MSPSTFRDLPLDPELLSVVAELGFDALTPIQRESIPVLLEGHDLIGQARTGSGKTVAFSLPMLMRLDAARRVLQGLVLCPTRELAAQVAREIRKLARRHAGLEVLVVAGGTPARPQRDALARGVHVVVGTPGRIVDLLEQGALDLATVKTVVLDEADRMLEMGFAEPMKRILRALPKTRQTALFSATFPPAIAAVSRDFQKDPVRVTIADESEASDVTEIAYRIDETSKNDALLRVLRAHPHESALVFCNLKATVVAAEHFLASNGVSVASLHGDLEQNDRDRVMAKFRNRSTRVLVATDVAARGLDVSHLDLVVNLDLPSTPDVYVHRIGRTGRAGRSGVAVSIVTDREARALTTVEALTRTKIRRESLRSSKPIEAPAASSAPMVTLFVSGGRKEKLRPGDLLGALTGEACGLDAKDVGTIEIHDHFTYVAIAAHVVERALAGLREGRIKGRRFKVGYVE